MVLIKGEIDDEINILVNNTYTCAKKVLNENLDILHKLAELLLEKETVMGKELDELIFSFRPGIKLTSHVLDDLGEEATAAEQAHKRSDDGDTTQDI